MKYNKSMQSYKNCILKLSFSKGSLYKTLGRISNF